MNPNIKARLVGQEFATHKYVELVSGTPSLHVIKALLADLAADVSGRCLLALDVTGAFLYGLMQREVAVRLPAEYGMGKQYVGLLRKSLYGLRDAPLPPQILGVVR